MVRRPEEWENWNREQRMDWLRKQRTQTKGGRKVVLKDSDAPRIWNLLKKYGNKSIVADLVGVSRMTIHRFLKDHPIPKTFVIEESMNLMDFPEMQIWKQRIKGFAGKSTINAYTATFRRFYDWMKKYHPERAKPSLWTSDDITEYLYGNKNIQWEGRKPYQWHSDIVPLRSLKLKAGDEFPHIDLGLLPTKKTHKAKRSLAGVDKYYLTNIMVAEMIRNATTRKAKAMIAFLYNTACRVSAMCKLKISDLHLDKHMVEITDKGKIDWLVYGLTETTIQLLKEYLEERGYPKEGWLFANGNNNKLTRTQVNDILREAGKRAGITDKVLTSKTFRKSFVKNALEHDISPMSLIGTGKNPKTCMCVGWNSDIIFQHYAPKMLQQIEEDRQKFQF